ncbi:MAG: hypothetical protein Q3X94_03530 [Oscillospiraceae bacterium]|nr:hypothetical protein [Oscillospiraceae bacterium]
MKFEKRSEGGGAEEVPQESRAGKQKPVFIYILILFTVAFVLILLSFVMHQRSNQQVLGELKDNVNALEELQDTMDENLELKKELSDTQEEAQKLQEQLDESEDQAQTLDQQSQALLLLYQLQQEYASQDLEACEKTLQKLDGDLAAALPGDDLSYNVVSPARRYQQIKEAVEAQLSDSNS